MPALLESWDRLLARANAHHNRLQAAWISMDSANDIPPFDDEDEQELVEFLTAIVETRREVEDLLPD